MIINIYIADEEVAGVGLLVLDIGVGLECAGAGADHHCGEADAARVDGVDGVGGDDQARDVGEVDDEEEEEGGVVVAVGVDVVVDEQQEEDDDDADDGGEERVEKLGEACAPEDVAVGALDGVEGEPSGWHDDDAEPEVGVGEDAGGIAEAGVLEGYLAEEEERRPGEDGGDGVAEDIFDGLLLFHDVVRGLCLL